MHTNLSIARNTISVLLITVATKLARIFGFIMIALLIPATSLGKFSLAVATVGILAGLTDFGIEWIIVRRMALNPSERSQDLTASLGARLFLSAIGYSLAVGGTYALGFGPEAVLLTALAGISLFCGSATNSLLSVLRVDLRMSAAVKINLLGALFYCCTLIATLYLTRSVTLLVLVLVATDLLIVGLTYNLVRQTVFLCWPPSLRAVSKLLAEAAPLGFAAVFVAAYFRLDTIILRKVCGLSAVGYYSVAYRVTECFLLLATAYSTSLFPVLSARSQGGAEGVGGPFRRSYRPIIWLMSILAFLICLYAEPITELAAPRYIPAAPSIAILVWSSVFMVANSLTGLTINSLGWQKVFLRITAINLAVNLGLNLFMIPRWQILGASAATVATEGINLLQQTLVLRALTGLRVHLVWIIPIFGGAAAYFLVAAAHRSAVGATMTIAVLILLGWLLGCEAGLQDILKTIREAYEGGR